ncbi:hypothetical protein IHE44_0008628 [Lamprotornis superbus]|uniref:Uncharacterized protein n=1 Tax=Lamprotornis superbus TaxID=245042 RepID=A0A835TXU5_9PASS|nr:hypothetical protein IHE44_0008628 [Lamprotornis superbus]
MDLGKACLAGARSLFTLLAALWDSLAGSVLSVRELLAPFLAHVAGRATAVAIRLWPHCQLTFKLLCSVTVVFISVYFLGLLSLCMMGRQYLSMLLDIHWDLLSTLILGVTNVLAYLSSALYMPLWLPYQLALILLPFATQIFTSIFFVGVYILKSLLYIAFPIVIYSVIYYNREVLWVLKRRVLSSFHHRQRDVRQLYQGAMLTLHRAGNSRPWHRLVDWVLQVTSRSQAGRMMNQGRDQLDAGQVPQPPAGAGQHPQTAREEPGTSWWKAPRKQQLNATAGNAEGMPDNLSVLLKEQEERKKCVICQDQTKTGELSSGKGAWSSDAAAPRPGSVPA